MQKAALFALVSMLSLPVFAQDAASETTAVKAASENEKKELAPATENAAAADVSKPAEAMGPTTLSVLSSPSGRIFLDGKDTGLDTPLVDHVIKPGTHTVRVVETATKREKTVTFHLEASNTLNLNLNLPKAEGNAAVAKEDGEKTDAPDAKEPVNDLDKEGAKDGAKVAEEGTGDADTAGPGIAAPADDWTWMTVAGWSGLGLGAMGLLAGTVVLTSNFAQEDGPLGFGLFGAGAGLVLGGGVLIYLDNELNSEGDAAVDVAGEAEQAWTPLNVLR